MHGEQPGDDAGGDGGRALRDRARSAPVAGMGDRRADRTPVCHGRYRIAGAGYRRGAGGRAEAGADGIGGVRHTDQGHLRAVGQSGVGVAVARRQEAVLVDRVQVGEQSRYVQFAEDLRVGRIAQVYGVQRPAAPSAGGYEG
ncbi:hypothetical protein LCGC14_2371230, partial [marine sediment metagenome]